MSSWKTLLLLALLAFQSSLAISANDGLHSFTNGTITSIPASGKPWTPGFIDTYTHRSQDGKAICTAGTVPVHLSTPITNLSFRPPSSVVDLTQALLSLTQQGSVLQKQDEKGMALLSESFNISAHLCFPAVGDGTSPDIAPTAVHFLTHGLAFDSTYWDFAPGYSYVDAAAAAGHATFLYDRLGTGGSSRPDPVATVQAPVEVAIATELLTMLRNGNFSGFPVQRIVAIGHSYGSILTQAMIAGRPQLANAAVLTGFSADFTGMPAFVLGVDLRNAAAAMSYRFGNLPDGYLVVGSERATQTGFFRTPNFEPAIIAKAFGTGQPLTFGESLTQFDVLRPAGNFSGPVAVVNGDSDLPFCFGNCTYPTDKASTALDTYFPASRNKSSYLAQDTGHGLNLHTTAPEAFRFIFDFLNSNGI